jgi:hypothetical protein
MVLNYSQVTAKEVQKYIFLHVVSVQHVIVVCTYAQCTWHMESAKCMNQNGTFVSNLSKAVWG